MWRLGETHGLVTPPSDPLASSLGIEGYNGYGSAERDLKEAKALDEADREIADLCAQVLQAYGELGMKAGDFARAYSSGLIVTDIRARLTELSHHDATLSRSKLYDWLERFSQGGVFGLAPQYKGRGGVGASLSGEVKNLLEYLYLDTNRPGVADVVRHIRNVYKHEELTEATARRYLMSLPKAVRLVWREGTRALEKVNPSVIRDYTLYKPMEIIVRDYMTQDFMLRYKDKVCRAKVCAFMDMRTRAIVGWRLRLTADSIGVATALQKCFDRFGLPQAIYFDNGREFKNQFLCGRVADPRLRNRSGRFDTKYRGSRRRWGKNHFRQAL